MKIKDAFHIGTKMIGKGYPVENKAGKLIAYFPTLNGAFSLAAALNRADSVCEELMSDKESAQVIDFLKPQEARS